jgi:hypothetical protein
MLDAESSKALLIEKLPMCEVRAWKQKNKNLVTSATKLIRALCGLGYEVFSLGCSSNLTSPKETTTGPFVQYPNPKAKCSAAGGIVVYIYTYSG